MRYVRTARAFRKEPEPRSSTPSTSDACFSLVRANRAVGGVIYYEVFDAAYFALSPARWSAAAAKAFFSNPFSPLSYSLPARMISAGADVFTGFAERRGKPPWNIDATPTAVDARPFGTLLHFARRRDRAVPRVLLVAPMSGHFATLLRGTVDGLIADHDVYITDWADARDVPLGAGSFGFDDYVAYVIDWLRLLGGDTHVIAVCQPVPAVLSAVAIMAAENDPAQPRSMVLMGGPIDVRVAPTAPVELAQKQSLEWFERELTMRVPAWYPGAGRLVYPGYLQLGAFVAMHPQRHFDAHLEIFNALVAGDGEGAAKRRAFYDEYQSTMDITAEFYVQTVDRIFKRAALMDGTMTWRGRAVDPATIRRTALMTIEGELDDISAPGQTYAAHALCSSIPAERKRHYLQPGVGHYGIFNGQRYRNEVEPQIAAFIAGLAPLSP